MEETTQQQHSFWKKSVSFKLTALLLLAVFFTGVYSCTSSEQVQQTASEVSTTVSTNYPPVLPFSEASIPSPDPRVGLKAGLFDAEETIWNLELVSAVPPPENFLGSTNTDLAFKDNYVIQGSYNGFMVWDISDPANPELVVDYLCPASQSDVSVYENLLFVSGEGFGGRLDCGTEGVNTAVSTDRLRGIRIFDITDIKDPQYISNVQTCRGSHTHSVLVDPNDTENVYVYVSGSAPVRPEEELPGCSNAFPEDDPESALFRIEVIKVPLANPEESAIVNSPRIFEDLVAPPTHGLAPDDIAALESARAEGAFIADIYGAERVLPDRFVASLLETVVEQRGGTGAPTAADSSALRENLSVMVVEMFGDREETNHGPNQCHDITLYPEIGLAGGACEGYGLLLDITNPAEPVRIDAVADSNFSYWHSATFNNDGTTVVFTDEWGGGSQAKCRANDPLEWGANAIFTIEDDGKLNFQSYFKMPAPQTTEENCVAHNGSMIPIPDRDVMVQSWYQGGINIFDFTDPQNPVEIAFHDRGPLSDETLQLGGSWSIYWYNGYLINSEIARGLDIFELVPSDFITENEIAAANTVHLAYKNAQGQPMYTWPDTYALAKAYVDQLERNRELDRETLNAFRAGIAEAERTNGSRQAQLLNRLADEVAGKASASSNSSKVNKLAETMRGIASNS